MTGAAGSGVETDRWTVLRLIRWSADYLEGKGIEQGRLDAEHLLAHALDVGRLQLYLQYDRPLVPEELDRFRPLLRRRARREPLQHVIGRTAFRDLELKTDARALVPRPETELLVQLVLDWARGRGALTAIDVGTGSGCIALALASEGPFERVWGIDISADALALARENAEVHDPDGRVVWREGHGLRNVPEARVDVVVSNPPYIARGEAPELEPEVREFEPEMALYAGDDGREMLHELIRSAPTALVPGGLLALEVGLGQALSIRDTLMAHGGWSDPTVHEDYTGRERFVTAMRRDD
ncbi:MAG TPA: peptide chain release factor N(5)-glutamine methyltransferase [Longimicrobiales bacterium]|nr:peptide chain release factor N(5)-glutamine methyltransferase [Longimicrobiales bacterium]